MIVETVIDIPSAQVNHSFDYKVPPSMEELIQPGIRIQVPFGRRQLLAFVVAIKEDTDFEGELRNITKVIDYQSYLNTELIQLSSYLADYLQAFRINILQAMLPSMLKVKYTAVFQVKNPQALARALSEQGQRIETDQLALEIEREDLETALPAAALKNLIDSNALQLDYRVINQTTQKKIKLLEPAVPQEELTAIRSELSARSHKQLQLLDYLIEHPLEKALTPNQLSDQAGVSRQIVNTAIDKKWLTVKEEAVYRDPLADKKIDQTKPQTLLPEQAAAYEAVKPAIINRRAETFLLQGVTGSGKTEVYLQLMEEVKQQGQTAILLVPEISLTPQMVERVVGRFGQGVAVLHSGLSITEKYDEWRRIIKGEASVVVGARSSIFAPLKNIGIIIIDEEHETTYKQTENPRYHARDVAIWRSRYHNCPLILGSATPSLESRARAEKGNYHLIKMETRINQAPMPPVTLVDMTESISQQGMMEFSPLLESKIREKIEAGEQVVLLLNRRGYASYLLCRACGYVVQCPRCDISLTYHKYDQQMKCHYCDYRTAVPQTCPQCGSNHIRTQGLGTQKVAETLARLFPSAPVIRMDNDTTSRKGSHEKLLAEFSQQPGSILLGTQMIAKGLDFEKVTLVGVINADTGLNLPDFRSAEKTFQLLTQVAGRTGRGKYRGEVIIQTYNPEHYVMHLAQEHDYEQFFYYEMRRRHIGQYPPYFFTTLVKVSSKHKGNAQTMIYQLKNQLQQAVDEAGQDLLVLGPSTGGIERINDYYNYHLLLKYKDRHQVQTVLSEVLMQAQEEQKRGIFISIDHEPQYFI